MHNIFIEAVCKNKTLRFIKKGVIRDYGTKYDVVIFKRRGENLAGSVKWEGTEDSDK